MLIQGKRKFCLNNHEIWSKMNRLTFHHAHGLLWNWHRVLVSKFRHISLFSFFLRVLSLFIASSFFIGLVIQKSATTLPWSSRRSKWCGWALNNIAIHICYLPAKGRSVWWKNCDRGLENAGRGRESPTASGNIFKTSVTVYHHTDRPLAGK